MTLTEIHEASQRLGSRVRQRNQAEVIAAAIVVIAFGSFLFLFDDPLMRLGSAMTIAATAFVIWQLMRRTSHDNPAEMASDVRSHYRARLMRERDMLASVPRWYLLPFLPGFVLFTLGKLTGGADLTASWVVINVVVPAAIFGGVWWINHRAAKELQQRLDATQ